MVFWFVETSKLLLQFSFSLLKCLKGKNNFLQKLDIATKTQRHEDTKANANAFFCPAAGRQLRVFVPLWQTYFTA